jgi:hypothetical protein
MFATSNASVLSDSVQQIKDAISDFRDSLVREEALFILERIVGLFNTEPLTGFLTGFLPSVNFVTWFTDLENSHEDGSYGVIKWPSDRDKRVAMQIELCRYISDDNNLFDHFLLTYLYSNRTNFSGSITAFATKVLDTLVRDIDQLIALRPVSPILLEAMRTLPLSGDDVLDEKLLEASQKFKNPAPQSLQDAVEKLWDSFEIIKKLNHLDTKKSVAMLLEQIIEDRLFRDHINNEMTALNDIGNKFQIRHFGTGKLPLNQKQLEYLFHRLYSLVRFLLLARNETKGKSLSD